MDDSRVKRLLAVAVAAILTVTIAVVPRGIAATTVTISGPGTLPYYGIGVISGTTSAPNQRVTIYFKGPRGAHFTARRHLVSDGVGDYDTTFTASRTWQYYAVAGGTKSAVLATRIVTATCTVSGPAFTRLPTRTLAASSRSNIEFAAFTATRGGLWAGVSSADNRFAVITWRRGHRPQVLARYEYTSVAYETESPGSVNVIGISAKGHVVTSVQDTDNNFNSRLSRFTGYLWTGRHWRELARTKGWTTVHPTGLTASGAIVGWVGSGRGKTRDFRIVRWSPNGRRITTLVDTKHQQPSPVVDGAGDVAYYNRAATYLRYRSGTTVLLPGYVSDDLNIAAAVGGVGHTMYGTTDSGQIRWDVGTDPDEITSTRFAGGGLNNVIAAVGARDDAVVGYVNPMYLRTVRGAYVRVPKQSAVDLIRTPGLAVNEHGSVAFTSARDGLVHFLRCRTR
jgi:hypothetical protein